MDDYQQLLSPYCYNVDKSGVQILFPSQAVNLTRTKNVKNCHGVSLQYASTKQAQTLPEQ